MVYIYPQAETFLISGSQDIVLLFLHGFTASPSELYPTARLINELSNYTICAPLLPGHGSTPRQLNRCKWEDWFKTVEEHIKDLKKNYKLVFVAGLSMGALLSLYAAWSVPDIKGAIAINAPIHNKSPLLTAASPLFRHFKPFYPKKDRLRLRELENQGRFAYDVIPVKAFQNLSRLRNLVIQKSEEIKIPVLLIQSLRDETIQPRSSHSLQEKIPNSQLIELSLSDHIATMGKEKEKIAQAIVDFISGQMPGAETGAL